MIRINLLPKEYQKKKLSLSLEKNTIYVVAGGAAILVLLAAYSFFGQYMQASKLNGEIAKARAEASNYDKEIKLVNELNAQKDIILTRLGTIEQLDRNRSGWVKVISDLGSRITDYLWLTNFGVSGGDNAGQQQQAATSRTVIEGQSFSINSLATFLVRLKKSPYLQNVDLVSIELEEEKGADGTQPYEAYNFVINCDLNMADDQVQTESNLASDKMASGSEF